MIELREITEENFTECFALQAGVDNENFVDDVIYSLAEAWVFRKGTEAFAIYNDEAMIGFVSMYIGEGLCQITNFMIDVAYQGRGFGTSAARICIDFLKWKYGVERISAPVNIDNIKALKFWEKMGFSMSETIENGYVFMRVHI